MEKWSILPVKRDKKLIYGCEKSLESHNVAKSFCKQISVKDAKYPGYICAFIFSKAQSLDIVKMILIIHN